MSVYESSSCDELDPAEYEAWFDEINRDLRDRDEFERPDREETDIIF